jgi:flagellar basal body-associated protein FliL
MNRKRKRSRWIVILIIVLIILLLQGIIHFLSGEEFRYDFFLDFSELKQEFRNIIEAIKSIFS